MAKSIKSKRLKSSEDLTNNTALSETLRDLDELDLGDADGSSGNLGMDNFKKRGDKNKLPAQKGRIEEL
ncbi:hypothetical protein [Pedobacter insulae]|uniref:Uncharacterized protein n=1 Tax=Pedobacter insulae TaxID=414048 RepID=A0A1I3AD28_9SPHI|nr:hypothetical protein [Pedobacter insulae]SFH48023.1 hypothetical protein SAMN04489864_11420 [Pedobacter insulae]